VGTLRLVKCYVVLNVSSTEAKFSQHAVFHITGAAFRNNIAAGILSCLFTANCICSVCAENCR